MKSGEETPYENKEEKEESNSSGSMVRGELVYVEQPDAAWVPELL